MKHQRDYQKHNPIKLKAQQNQIKTHCFRTRYYRIEVFNDRYANVSTEFFIKEQNRQNTDRLKETANCFVDGMEMRPKASASVGTATGYLERENNSYSKGGPDPSLDPAF